MSKRATGNGVAWRGPGLDKDRTPTALVLTGTDGKSENPKTGPMQAMTSLVDDGTGALEALRTGKDEAVCGTCIMRGGRGLFGRMLAGVTRWLLSGVKVSGMFLAAFILASLPRTCYVNSRSPETMSKVLRGVPVRKGVEGRAYGEARITPGLPLRLGAYGEIAGLAPLKTVLSWIRKAGRWTMYTELWDRPGLWRWRRVAMASCQGLEEAAEAIRRGWRPFLIVPDGVDVPAEIEGRKTLQCPADPSLPKRAKPVQCATCGLCNGTDGKSKTAVWIRVHGKAGQLLGKVMATLASFFGAKTSETLEV